ncbi:MAG: carboxypeptidase regulatory-like domain-containing protein, partial [Acidobacteriota bacterium]|nr:carboxypeptidase regulatory-like domain-containing protein [Acidobacteriota bacterium]
PFMGRLTRNAIILALSLSCAEICSAANSQANQQNKTSKKATGSVSGRITIKGKGKGGIVIGLRTGEYGPQMGPILKGVTDQEGNYRITDLPAGTYQVTPAAPAFVVADFGSFGQRGKSVILADGENVEGIDFSMVRGGVITGKVTQTDGRPVIEERINVEPDRQGLVNQSSSTDDRGIYRVFGLPAGKYKISIGQSPDTFSGGTRPGRPTYERVFYPDVTNPDEAKVVELGEGTEATNIDITVGESLSGFSAAGVITDGETNQPLANLRFGLQRIIGERDSNFIGTSVVSDRLGAFRFENLAPGKYSVFIMPQQNSELRVDPVAFEVVDQNVTGIMVRTSRGASVSVTIVLEGSHDKTVQNKLAQLRLQVYVRSDVPGNWFAQMSSINPDGSFRVGGLQAGVAQFQLSAQDRGLVTGFVISRLERDGVVVPRGVEVKAGEQVSGMRIIVVYGSGIIRGTIKVENGPLPTGARLMIRLVKPEDPSFSLRPQDADARGRFIVEGVPAGTYDLYIHSYVPGVRSGQPFTKQSVTVTEGSVTEVEPVLDLEAKPSPRP